MLKLASTICFSLYLCACVSSTKSSARAVPENLRVPSGNILAIELHGAGVQIYVCQAKKDEPTKYEWTLKAPDARLSDDSGRDVGHHYAGPTWEASDGSRVIGKLEQKKDAPGAADIPWLLLSAKSNEGVGRFARVSFIQRLDTKGGKAPTEGCDAAHAGQEKRVEYAATYLFYVPGI